MREINRVEPKYDGFYLYADPTTASIIVGTIYGQWDVYTDADRNVGDFIWIDPHLLTGVAPGYALQDKVRILDAIKTPTMTDVAIELTNYQAYISTIIKKLQEMDATIQKLLDTIE